MTPGHRRFRRGWWRVVPLVLGVLLFLAADIPADPPANPARGGIPPAFFARDGVGPGALMLMRQGEAAYGPELLPLVADPVRLRGRVYRHGDLLMVDAPMQGIARV